MYTYSFIFLNLFSADLPCQKLLQFCFWTQYQMQNLTAHFGDMLS